MMMMNSLPFVRGREEGGMGMSGEVVVIVVGIWIRGFVLKCEKKITSTPGVEPGSTRVKRLESE